MIQKIKAEIERRRKERIEKNIKIEKGEIFNDTEDEFNKTLARYSNRIVSQEMFELICFIESLEKEPISTEETELNSLAFLEQMGYTCIPPGKEQKSTEKQDYSGLNDLEKAIHRGFLSAGVENVSVVIIKETAKECLAQMKPAEWSEEDRKRLDWIMEHFSQGGGLYDDLIYWLTQLPKRFNLQSKQEWSKDDEEMISSIKQWLDEVEPQYVEKEQSWLKSLPERFNIQPKQDVLPSLSEKEIICLKRTLDYLCKEHNRYGGEDFTNEIAVLEWLITHPIFVYSSQPHWKPSEEQMKSLKYALGKGGTYNKDVLDSLLTDLQNYFSRKI